MSQKNLQESAHALFEYIKEVSQLNQLNVLDIEKQIGFVPLRKLDDPTYIKLFSRDTITGAEENENELLISFHKPDFCACPAPDASLERWLVPGWNDYFRPLEHLDVIEQPAILAADDTADISSSENEQLSIADADAMISAEQLDINGLSEQQSGLQIERFEDDAERIMLFDAWAEARAEWVEKEKHTQKLREAFNDLFDIYNLYRQSPVTLEIMIGNGLLTDKNNKEIRHPLFLKRVSLTLEPVQNMLLVSDTDEPPQMYLPMFTAIEDVNADTVRPLEKLAEEKNIHPLDHHDGADLLKSVAHSLYANSRYVDQSDEFLPSKERIVVRWEPYIFLRKRPDGTIKAIQSIISDIDGGAEIPGSLKGILGEFEQPVSAMVQERDTDNGSVWAQSKPLMSEDEDILLPKPANREQLQIVRQIDHSSAVLVQGPPGTGKTHTIANLLGHFLAKGQTVLVTSHTSKALNVLREKVPKDIQALCVAMLDDNRADMEESVNTIIERTSMFSIESQRDDTMRLRQQRHQTLIELQKARELVYAIRHKEFEPIVYGGDSWSPSKAASYVAEHEDLKALIPGAMICPAAFPLNQQELEWLYASNELLSNAEENELSIGLPKADELMTPEQFSESLDLMDRLNLQLQAINAGGQMYLSWAPNRHAVIDQRSDQVYAQQGYDDSETTLHSALTAYQDSIPGWAVFAISDGAEDTLPRKRWERLLQLIDETYTKAQPVLQSALTKPIKIHSENVQSLVLPYQELLEDARKHGKVKKGLFLKKEKKAALDAVTIAGNQPELPEDLERVLAYFELLSLREQLEQLWNSLIANHGGRRFDALGDEPERSCYQQKKAIAFWVDWAQHDREELCKQAEAAGIGSAILQPIRDVSSFTDEKAASLLQHIQTLLIPSVHLLHLVNELCSFTYNKEKTIAMLEECTSSSALCAKLRAALDGGAAEDYELAMNDLVSLEQKSDVQTQRSALLCQLSKYAPQWAEAIRERAGIHGNSTAPENLMTAWKVRQLDVLVDEILSTPLTDAEKRVTGLSTQYRKETEKLATALAWYYLQQRIDENPRMRQSLNGWKQTIAKIGKGTGKKAPALRYEARKLMIDCQKAVPAWIMPVSAVMNSVDPATTKFDVIIVDEASQSDITASAILYMGKKIIIVGDDEQVSPMAVGFDETRMQSLMNALIKDKIPNAHLWDAKTSLYDIAAQVYQPLMLREHFRCVPDIIGFSNMLSYQGKIKPLREAGSSPFKTATVSYRVQGVRKGRTKTNEKEAEAIVALIQSCIQQPAYANKTFGVISMLGDDQAKLIGRKLANDIPLAQYEKHQILCGNASNFQGDERDVIFLSLVDSHDSDGPLSMASGEGQGSTGKSLKQRYNVAVSRARDQLWAVHSLDYSADLKPGDIRRRLLEYVTAPHVLAAQAQAIDDASDSPFEAEVAKALTAQGYHIIQQWQVGAYFIDMVAICGNQKIGIECDGERWHSGEEKIREDMERQSILERLGWKFIRIRGSEYFRARSQAISRVVSELNQDGIFPEASIGQENAIDGDALLNCVKQEAERLMEGTSIATVTDAPQSKVALTRPQKLTSQKKNKPQENTKALQESTPTKQPQEREGSILNPEQNVLSSPANDLLSVIQKAGFACIDNRNTSGILWVIYDREKVADFETLEQNESFEGKLERRGAVATGGIPAWRVQTLND